jgi:1-acyl-sn-glycerol-3-phosphate acyltransferase
MNTNVTQPAVMDAKFYRKVVKVLTVITKPFVRLSVTGLENIPSTGGAIIAPNHISNLDPILLGVKIGRTRPVQALAKQSLFTAPFIGGVVSKMGHIPVQRGSMSAGEVLHAAEKTLRNGGLVAVYPEGTVPKTNLGELGALKSGVSRLALTTLAPIIPIGQWGAQNIVPVHGKPFNHLGKALFHRPRHAIVIGEPFTIVGLTITEANILLAEKIVELTETAKTLTMLK